MDTNDYRPSDSDKLNGQNNRVDDVFYTTQPSSGFSQYGDSGQDPLKHRNKRNKGRGGRGVLIAIIMILCLITGGVVTAYVIMPGITGDTQNIAVAQTAQPEGAIADQPNSEPIQKPELEKPETVQNAQGDAALTTDSPNIGGQMPNIDSENPIVQIAQQVGPAVVGVTVSVDQDQGQGQEALESGYGTGIILTEDGYIVTNNHVIAGSDSVKITLIDGKQYPASVVGADATTDIAVLKVNATGLSAAALGDSDTLLVGETVVAIGNPLGSDLAGSVTAGIVSALNREISTKGYSQKYIQTDAAINPGNSGGALVNVKGEVVGINTLKSYLAGFDDYGMPIGTEGIGFAIPITQAKPIIEQLMKTGNVERPGIGISCLVDITNTYNENGAPKGVTVVEVVKAGPADDAGISPYDIITSINGNAVETVEELTAAIQAHTIGAVLDLTVWREGREYKAKVTVGDLNNMG